MTAKKQASNKPPSQAFASICDDSFIHANAPLWRGLGMKAPAGAAAVDAAIEEATASVLITDKNGKIVYVNSVFEKTTGYKRAETPGKTPNILKSGRHQPVFYEDLWTTLRAGKVWNGIFTNKRKDGTPYHEEAVIVPVAGAGGLVINFVSIGRDITESMELQQRMARTEKLAAVGTLASGIAHEINNPLSTIMGLAQILLDDSKLTGEQKQDVQDIKDNVRRVGRITQALLQFGRNGEPRKEALDLKDVITETMPLLTYELMKEKVDLELKLPDKPLPVMGDFDQLQQLLVQLAINSMQAMRGRKGSKLLFKAEGTAGRVLLHVKDNGVGIPEADLARLFEPFFTTKPVGSGTGLGLSLCYGIAVDHGGAIMVASVPGGGATFTLELPKKDL